MKSIRYKGGADVRAFSFQDMQMLGASHPSSVVFDKSVNHGIVELSNKAADILLETGEFVLTNFDGVEDDVTAAQDLPDPAEEPTEEGVKEESAAPKSPRARR